MVTGSNDRKTGKREAILTSAARVFGQKGFYEATIEEIANEAGIGKGTVYEYFPSKLELFKEMHNYYSEAYLRSYDRLEEFSTYAERLKRVFVTHLLFAVGHAEFARVLLVNPASINEDLQFFIMESRRDKIAKLQALIEGGIRAGEFREIDSQVALEMAASFLGSLIYMSVFSEHCPRPINGPVTEEEAVQTADKALDIFLHGICK